MDDLGLSRHLNKAVTSFTSIGVAKGGKSSADGLVKYEFSVGTDEGGTFSVELTEQ